MANEKGMLPVQPNPFVRCLGAFVIDYVKQTFRDSDAKLGTTKLSLIVKIYNEIINGRFCEGLISRCWRERSYIRESFFRHRLL